MLTVKQERPLLLDVTRLIWRCWAGRQATGIDRVCLAYLSHYRHQALAVIQHPKLRSILPAKASDTLFDLLLERGSHFRRDLIAAALRHAIAIQFDKKGEGKLYLNTGHTGLNKRGYVDWIRRADVRPIYLVHDLIPLTHPEFCKPGEDLRHRFRMSAVLDTASGIIGNSSDTLRVLADFAAQTHKPLPPTLAAWLGTEQLPAPAPKPNISKPYFITVGTIEGRKNHKILLEVWSSLIESMGDATPSLVIVGHRGWANEETLARLDNDPALKGHVIEINSCADQELATWLGHARALLFPSFAEGYGMPLVEALAVSVPVIVSDLAVFREIAGDVPEYVPPSSLGAWNAAILNYLERDSTKRAAQLARIKSFNPPSWVNHFKLVDQWLESLNSADG